jgi:hypothetical protein
MADRTPTGLLIIRTWREEGSDAPFRAQIRVIDDDSSGDFPVNVVELDDVISVVRAFLEPWSMPSSEPVTLR